MTPCRDDAKAPVQVTLDSIGETFTAGITDIVPAADPVSRTFTAKIALNRKGVKSGMFGRGAISMWSTVNGISVALKQLSGMAP
jgi:membrane fusion protein, multidrug efflux system